MKRKPKEDPQIGLDFAAPPPAPPALPRPRPRAVSDLRGMVRHPDHDTSLEAAESLEPTKHKLQEEVYQAIREIGPMNDGELEELPRFKGRYAYSTVRKRRSELSLAEEPRLFDTGIRRPHPLSGKSMIVWGLALD